MSSHDHEQTIRTLFARLSERDFDGLIELLDEDVEFDLAYAPQFLEMPVRGKAAMKELLTNVIGAMFEPFKIEVTTTYPGADGATVAAEYRSEAVVKHNGKEYLNRYAGIFKFSADKIVFWREYHNTEEATRALS